jgi:hypothetical protein
MFPAPLLLPPGAPLTLAAAAVSDAISCRHPSLPRLSVRVSCGGWLTEWSVMMLATMTQRVGRGVLVVFENGMLVLKCDGVHLVSLRPKGERGCYAAQNDPETILHFKNRNFVLKFVKVSVVRW